MPRVQSFAFAMLMTTLGLATLPNSSHGGSIQTSTLARRQHHLQQQVNHLNHEVHQLQAGQHHTTTTASSATSTAATHTIAADNLAPSAPPSVTAAGAGTNYTYTYASNNTGSSSPVVTVTGSSSPIFPTTAPFSGTNVSTPTYTTPTYSAPTSSAPVSSAPAADAFINFGSGPYPNASSLTTGNPQSFLNSPVFTHLFGAGGPTAADITHFENQVVSTIQQTYNNAGVPINLTTDPNAAAAHTMSLVSGASYAANPNAIGITSVGYNGFVFLDKFNGITNETDLATAIGHTMSHELMHAFGIADHPEQTGPYTDAAITTVPTLIDPKSGFSPVAAGLLANLNFQAVGTSVTSNGAQSVDGAQVIAPTPTPEPSTVAAWGLTLALVGLSRRRRRLRVALAA